MPTIHHPKTGASYDVPAAVVPFWTTRAGWALGAPKRSRSTRARSSSSSTRAVEDPDENPGSGSSTNPPTEE